MIRVINDLIDLVCIYCNRHNTVLINIPFQIKKHIITQSEKSLFHFQNLKSQGMRKFCWCLREDFVSIPKSHLLYSRMQMRPDKNSNHSH